LAIKNELNETAGIAAHAMKRIEKIAKGNTEIFVVDYSDCKESEMIEIVIEVKKQVISGKEPVCILSIYNDKSYVTAAFMRQVENETREALPFIKKQAITGLNDTKRMILKGYNFLFRKNIQAFDTREQAFEFLADESTTDSSNFWDPVAKL